MCMLTQKLCTGTRSVLDGRLLTLHAPKITRIIFNDAQDILKKMLVMAKTDKLK